MKPIPIVLIVNFSFYLILFLIFYVLMNRPELIPLFLGFQTAGNLLFTGIFYVDGKANISLAFGISAILCLGLTIVGFYLLSELRDEIPVEDFSDLFRFMQATFLTA